MTQWFRCERGCGVTRYREVNTYTGARTPFKYKYPKSGYLLKGQGRLDAKGRDALCLATISRGFWKGLL
jgi:hypothetical protein